MKFLPLESGKSVEGLPIEVYRFVADPEAKYLYLIAGVHGDEKEGIYILQRLFEGLIEPRVNMIVVPVVNPDGQAKNSRMNANGVDLNRNLPSKNWSSDSRGPKYYPGERPLSEVENIFLDSLFQEYPPFLIMSFHSWKPMLNYNGNCKDIALFLQRYNNYPICDDIEGHPTPGSLGEYGPEKYCAPVLTLEFPLLSTQREIELLWQENSAGLKDLMVSELLTAQNR